METVSDFIFLGFRINTEGDCSHEIKRCLLLRRKAMTNLDRLLKSRDITLPTKVYLFKAMVFPVVMDGCELDHKEGWVWKNWWFWTVVLEKTLESPLDCKQIKPVTPKGNQPWIFIEILMLKLKLQSFGHLLQRANSLEKTLILGKTEVKGKRGRQRMRWLDDISDNGHEFEQAQWDSEG